jgi:hypothetical protein
LEGLLATRIVLNVWLTWLALLGLALSASGQAGPGLPVPLGRGIQSSPPHRGDSVRIHRITPKTGADLPVPTEFPYTIEVAYSLTTSPRGSLEVEAYEWVPGENFRSLLTPFGQEISRGRGSLIITTPTLSVPRKAAHNSQLILLVRLKGEAGEDLGYSLSYNYLAASVVFRQMATAARRNEINLLRLFPKPGSLRTQRACSFDYYLSYSQASPNYAFVNFDIGSRQVLLRGAPWYTLVVPLPRAPLAGTAEIRSRDYFFPPRCADEEVFLSVSLRLDPLGSAAQVLELGPWRMLPPQPVW